MILNDNSNFRNAIPVTNDNNIENENSADSIQISRGRIKVINFDTEKDNLQNTSARNLNPLNAIVKKQQVISFAPEHTTSVIENLNSQVTTNQNLTPINTIKEKQQVISFAPEKVNEKNKIECSNTQITGMLDSHDIDFITGLNGHLYVNLNEGILELCNFYVSPIKIIIKDNGLYQEIFYKMKCVLENGEEEKTISISSYDLNDPKWINLKLGIKYYTSAKNNSYALFKIYLSKQFRSVSQEYQYDMVGWKFIGKKYLYLNGNGAIGCLDNSINGSTNKRIEIDPSLTAYSALNGSLTLIDLSDNYEKTLPLFLYSHLSVLTELFNLSGALPKFVLWIYGLTGSMKTSVSTIFFNLFNRISKPEISATFKDTPSAIEIKAFESKDSTLLIDDYHPTISSLEKKNMEALASHILRMYGDGITKSRATKTMGKQKQYPPRGLCVITGEDRLGGESTVARYLGIEVNTGDYKTDILSYHQNNPLIYSTHIYYFIQWISYNFDNVREFIKNKFPQYRNENINIFHHKRLNECFAIFRIISEILLNYFMSIGYFDNSKASTTLKCWNNIMLQAIRIHEDNNTMQAPAIMYIIAIDELIRSNKCTLATIGKSNSEKQNIMGYRDDNYYYLIPDTAYTNVKNFWKGQGIEFPVSQERINKDLDNLKVIETSNESGKIRRTVKCNPDGKNRKRFLKLKIEMINKILNY